MSTTSLPDSLYRLFLAPDERRLKFDEEGLRSFVPLSVASRIAELVPSARVLDAFCGVGGNSISFAMAGSSVVAVDIDPLRLEMAKANAGQVGVARSIAFSCGRADHAIEVFDGDAIYLDPPWGGSSTRIETFKLTDFAVDVRQIFAQACGRPCRRIALKLPPNIAEDEVRVAFPGIAIHRIAHPRMPNKAWINLGVLVREPNRGTLS